MPLPIAPAGEELTVRKILADEKNKRHFENLGILGPAQGSPF